MIPTFGCPGSLNYMELLIAHFLLCFDLNCTRVGINLVHFTLDHYAPFILFCAACDDWSSNMHNQSSLSDSPRCGIGQFEVG